MSLYDVIKAGEPLSPYKAGCILSHLLWLESNIL
jgi:GR25 family glycosyltransferase involved in LPS biosynthesis